MAKEFGIKLNRKHPCAPNTPKGCIWVNESEEDYTTIDKAKRWKSKAAAKRAGMEPCDEVDELPPNVQIEGQPAVGLSLSNAGLGVGGEK